MTKITIAEITNEEKLMDEEQIRMILNEVGLILAERKELIIHHYSMVRDEYQNEYGWLALDTIRQEICLCIIFGLPQAALTLTIHLLESLLKYALITHHALPYKENESQVRGRAITSMVDQFKEAQEKYGSAKLENNINKACSLRIITKEQKNKLRDFRKNIRDAFVHADKAKTFGDQTIPVRSMRIKDGKFEIGESGEPKISDLIIAQGIAQVELAKVHAIPCFLYIDQLVRQIRDKVFNSSSVKSNKET